MPSLHWAWCQGITRMRFRSILTATLGHRNCSPHLANEESETQSELELLRSVTWPPGREGRTGLELILLPLASCPVAQSPGHDFSCVTALLWLARGFFLPHHDSVFIKGAEACYSGEASNASCRASQPLGQRSPHSALPPAPIKRRPRDLLRT